MKKGIILKLLNSSKNYKITDEFNFTIESDIERKIMKRIRMKVKQ
jgi:hypothetical protein